MAAGAIRYDLLDRLPQGTRSPSTFGISRGLPVYEGPKPFGQAVSPEQQYGTASQLELQGKGFEHELALEQMRQREELDRERRQQEQDRLARQRADFDRAVQEGKKKSERDELIRLIERGGKGGSVSGPSLQDVQAQEFARAKERAGNLARASLTGLQEAMSARGISGSGAELEATAERVMSPALSRLGELNTAQMREALETSRAQEEMRREDERSRQQALLGLLRSTGTIY